MAGPRGLLLLCLLAFCLAGSSFTRGQKVSRSQCGRHGIQARWPGVGAGRKVCTDWAQVWGGHGVADTCLISEQDRRTGLLCLPPQAERSLSSCLGWQGCVGLPSYNCAQPASLVVWAAIPGFPSLKLRVQSQARPPALPVQTGPWSLCDPVLGTGDKITPTLEGCGTHVYVCLCLAPGVE